MKSGILIYDSGKDRFDIAYHDTDPFKDQCFYGGLSCGTCFEFRLEDKSYIPVRIEYSHRLESWVLHSCGGGILKDSDDQPIDLRGKWVPLIVSCVA